MDPLTPCTLTPLARIAHPKGDVYHALKATDEGYAGFGEAYFTTVLHGVTKGWKQHTRMVMNLVVVAGEVTFHLHDAGTGRTASHTLGEGNYARLTVPPGWWMAFTGTGAGTNLVCNLASIAHDPAEARNVDLSTFPLP
ncbi:dTDP-4-dehydrorhamnose 3,5-epimerase [Pseudoduganella lutea]|uniref:dTDP-4-dehydrorhamnose 3,5-epimerase n=1 Tax=Pseudoduganella lutea TaxID=321985 RepID=A0A4P6KY64_9BURK|nr:dTDP-4-dehydrorhamnose 3,5-epimerase [Pseudoduganella lutea]QBE64016.1 dTDP-4-dehydrorhamnose 3,5-epimerase [Pseudoduganella lutea]